MNDKFSDDLLAVLAGIDRPGTFAVSGSEPAFLPGLEVAGLGTIAFPLARGQAAELKALCEQAPYGKGEQTLVDTSVRRVWRLKPDQFSLSGPDWAQYLARTVASVQEALGLEEQKLEASLYDLLLYEEGGFFLPHRDGEKADRMVATLVVVLPSSFEGGELVVRHEGEAKTIDHAPGASRLIQHAAFYADCEHELKPLRKGHRLCLVYNLSLARAKGRVLAPATSSAIGAAARVLSQWATDEDAGKLVVTLGHQYTEEGVSWDALKGTDRPKARVLLEAARRAGCRAYLALLTFHETGEAEYAPRSESGGRRRRSGWYEESDDAADYRMGEVYDSTLAATHWHDPAGGAFPLATVAVVVDEIVGGEDALTSITPDVDFQGFTGNEGMTLDRWYRHAAVILWPDRRHHDMIAQGGCRNAAEVLAGMADRWTAAGKPEAERAELRSFAAALVRNWHPVEDWRTLRDARKESLFRALAALGDAELIRAYLTDVLPQDARSDPGELFVAACEPHGWAAFQKEIATALTATTEATLARNAGLVESLCLAKPKKDKALPELRVQAARRFVARLIEIDRAKVEQYEWERRTARKQGAEILARLGRGLSGSGQHDLLSEAVAHAFSLPLKYPLPEAHLAALEEMRPWLAKNRKSFGAGMAAWVDGCESELAELTVEMPQPPTDFSRRANSHVSTAESRELAKFMADPTEKEHRFRAVQSVRTNLEHLIRREELDLDLRTEKRGSPHTLACTKNTASYQAALKKYHADVKRLADVRSLRG